MSFDLPYKDVEGSQNGVTSLSRRCKKKFNYFFNGRDKNKNIRAVFQNRRIYETSSKITSAKAVRENQNVCGHSCRKHNCIWCLLSILFYLDIFFARSRIIYKVGATRRGVHKVIQAPCAAEHATHAAGTP